MILWMYSNMNSVLILWNLIENETKTWIYLFTSIIHLRADFIITNNEIIRIYVKTKPKDYDSSESPEMQLIGDMIACYETNNFIVNIHKNGLIDTN